ncbi:MAG: aminotransferase class V-fold PLP-dependent enzyme [Casimicrobiaceae bacterium]
MSASAARAVADLEAACAALGEAPLDSGAIDDHLRPLFSRVLHESGDRVYLANHSLGRPLDAMAVDVQEGLAAWYTRLGDAWEDWEREMTAHRARLAALIGASRRDAIIPKASAGQGLRAVLNTYDTPVRVVATRGEFDSVDIVLREYARRGRIRLHLVDADPEGRFHVDAIAAALGADATLVVLSPIMFQTGQCVADVPRLVAAAHAAGAKVMLDLYHVLGVVPCDVQALGADFAIGGCYKYLRGGPGACFLYVAPALLDAGLRSLDVGWFGKERAFAYERPEPPRYAKGGDGWLESTPAVLPFYQARSGQRFTLGVGVPRLRAYSLAQQRRLVGLLREAGVPAQGGDAAHGAFVTLRDRRAPAFVADLDAQGIVVDARGDWLRLCPDVLTTDAELARVARALRTLWRDA